MDRNGAHKGFDIDIAKDLSKRTLWDRGGGGVRIRHVRKPDSAADSGKIDVIAATLTITEEGKREVDFSTPYFVTGQMILVRADSKITKYQDLAGKKVATIRGSTGDIAIEELVLTAERIKFEGNFEALQALKERRVEAFVQDYVLLYALLQKNPGLKMAGLQPFRPGRYGLAVRKGDKEWLEFINGTLNEDERDGRV